MRNNINEMIMINDESNENNVLIIESNIINDK